MNTSPGPWTTYIDNANDGWIADAKGELIACAVRSPAMEANARLIAEAPTMLEVIRQLAWEHGPSEARDKARTILARIDGEDAQ